MAEIIINDVKYTNVPNKKAGTKFASALTQSNIGMSQAVQDYVNSSYFYALINAIDINWDGIDIGENSYINTTSDLIKWIETKAGDIDLSSYATVTYVNQKIEDLVGTAPETLDTLEEIAAALQNDATLSYVTEALSSKANTADVYDKTTVDNMIGGLDSTYASISYVTTELEKKADINDIPSTPDLTPYVTYTQANSYYAGKNEIPDMTDYATVSYVTSELENKADINDIPSAPDLTPYVTYTQANSYYVDLNSNQTIDGTKKFNSLVTINSGLIPQLTFTLNNHQVGALNYNVIYIDGRAEYAMKLGGLDKTVALDNGANDFYIPTKEYFNTYFPSNVSYCLPIAFKDNNNNYITANKYGIVDLSAISSSAPDLTNYVSYTQANSYYVTVEGTKQLIYGAKTFIGDKRINFRQGTSTNKLGFTLYDVDEKEVGGLEWRPDTIGGRSLLSLQQYIGTGNKFEGVNMGYLGFRLTDRSYKYHLVTPLPSYVNNVEPITDSNYKTFFMPLVFQNGNNKIYTASSGLVDLSTLIPSAPDLTPYVTYTQANSYYAGKNEIPDMTDYATVSYVTSELENKADISDIPSAPDLTPYVTYADANTYYVDVTSYNTLYAEVQHLAYLISYYHPVPTPEPSLLTPSAKWSNTHNEGTTMDNVSSNESVIAVQVGGQPVTCTFDGTPETGWTITQNGLDNSTASVTLNGLDITVDPSSANDTNGMKRLTVSRDEDSSYSAGTAYFKVRVLSDVEDTNFFWHDKEQNIPVGQSKFVKFYNYWASGNIQFTSDDPNITVVGGRDNDGYYGATITSSGVANATITATLYGEDNNVLTTATMIVTSSAPSLLTPTAEWIESNTQMSFDSSFTIDKSELGANLSFNGTPSTGWTFTDPQVTGITVSNVGGIDIDTYNVSEGNYRVGVYYPGDSTYDTLTTFFDINITDNQANLPLDPTPLEPPTVDEWFIDDTTVASNQATYTEDDSTSHVLIFSATPAGWTITDPNVSGVVVDNVNLTVTFTPSLMPTGQCIINVQRESGDGYDYGSGTFTINITGGNDDPQ